MRTAQLLRRPLPALAAVTAAHVALRLALVVGRDGPINFADETGYLVNARVLAGGTPGTLDLAAFYRGGYSLLLVPAVALGRSPQQDYLLALATNALLSAAVVPLLFLLLRRVFGAAAGPALGAAAVAGLYPPLVVTTQMAWTESLLPPLLLVALLGIAGTLGATRRAGWGALAGGAVGGMWAVHGRAAPLLVSAALVLGVAAARVPAARLAAAVAGATAVAVVAAGSLLNAHLLDASWGGTPDRDLDKVLRNATDPGAAVDVAALAIGQLWYLVVAGFALTAVGVAAVVERMRAREAETTAVGAFLLLSLAGLVVLVGLFLTPAQRPDHVVYGRYAEVVAPLLIALGLLRLRTAPWRRVALEAGAGLAVAAVAVVALHPYRDGLVTASPVNWLTVLALPPLLQPGDRMIPATALLAAAVGAAAVLGVARRRPRLAAVGLAAAFVVSAVAVRVVLISARDAFVHVSATSGPLRSVPGLVDAERVAYDMAAYDPVGLYGYQWELDRARFVLFDSRRDAVPAAAWVVAGPEWAPAQQLGAQRVWVDDEVRQAVWRLPSAPAQG